MGGSALAANYGATSVDHIEYLDLAGVKALSENNTVASLLPGAFYFLKETQQPPIELLREPQGADGDRDRLKPWDFTLC